MSANPMMEQVGRLIGGLLAGGGEVFLPGVGSLYTERQPARRINRREVLPPQRRVTFTSQQRGTSLVDEIARVLQTNGAETDNLPTMAQSVYDRWIARALEGETLTVDGVGVLKHKHFTPDEAFDRRLNPQGSKPVRLPRPRRRFDWACWIGVVAIVCAAGIGLYAWQMFRIDAPETIPATRLTPARTTDSLSVNARPDSVAAQTPATPATPSTPSAAGTPSTPSAAGTPCGPETRSRRRSFGSCRADFGPPLRGAGRFQHRGECRAGRIRRLVAGGGHHVRRLPLRREVHGFALRVG